MFPESTVELIKKKIELEEKLNAFSFNGIEFGNLVCHTLDNFSAGYKGNYSLMGEIRSWLWVISKLRLASAQPQHKNILMVPADIKDFRCLQLFEPIAAEMEAKEYKICSLNSFYQVFVPADLVKLGAILIKDIGKIVKVFRIIKKETAFSFRQRSFLMNHFFVNLLVSISIRRFLQKHPPKIILVDWDRHRFQTLLVSAANTLQIKTATLVHGSIYTPLKFVPLIAQHCLCWGKEQFGFFTSFSVDPSRLIITGNSRIGGSNNQKPVAELKAAYNIDPEKKIVLHASQNFPNLKDTDVIEGLLHGLNLIESEWQLVIRLHPAQQVTEIKKLLFNVANVVLLPKEASLPESLAIANLVVLVNSTFSMDAIFAGVPVGLLSANGNVVGLAKELQEKANAKVFDDGVAFCNYIKTIDSNTAIKESFNFDSELNFAKDYCQYTGRYSALMVKKYIESSLA